MQITFSSTHCKFIFFILQVVTDRSFNLTVKQSIFDKIYYNQKSVEARIAIPRYTQMEVGDLIHFLYGPHVVSRKIKGKAMYKTFRQMLTVEGIQNCLPGVKDLDEGIAFYNNLYSQRQNDVVAFQLEEVKN